MPPISLSIITMSPGVISIFSSISSRFSTSTRIGLSSIVHTLDALHAVVPDGRYRVTPLLRLIAERGGSFLSAHA